ncbi:hypothetical protein [Kineococcus sp. SYSU DK004]|uniref:hypothetical protein n=1 Tax=Kineococcus sp. SYSU DK004 TaxID=3383125 RepID=UPI003D7E8357
MSYVEEALLRERLAELHRRSARARLARAVRAERRAEVAVRRAERLSALAASRLAAVAAVADHGPEVVDLAGARALRAAAR